MNQTDTVLFDLDDTLVAFDAVTEISWRQVCDKYTAYNKTYSSNTLFEVIRKYGNWYWSDDNRHRTGRLDIGTARKEFMTAAFGELNLPVGDAIKVADDYSKVRINNMYINPDAREILSFLKTENYKLALLTNGNSSEQRNKITRFNLESYFNCILIEGELGFGKPDIRVFRTVLEKLNSRPDKTIMIGDNLKWDVAGPQEAGIKAVWYDWKNTGLPLTSQTQPDFIINNLRQIIDIINSINSPEDIQSKYNNK